MTDRHRTATSDYSGCYLDAQFVTTCIVLCGHLIGTAVRARYIQLWRKATAVEMVGRRGGGGRGRTGGAGEQWLVACEKPHCSLHGPAGQANSDRF